MYAVEGVVIVSGSAEVVAKHTVVGTLIETTLGQHADRQCIGVIGIFIQEAVVVAHRSIFHSTVSVSLIRVLGDAVLLRGSSILQCANGRKHEVANGLILQLGLELGIYHVQVDTVILKLVQDVERSIVREIISIGIKGTR